jgi:potassium efflux system protein
MQKDILGAVAFSIEGLLTERREQEAKEVQNALSQVEKELSGKHPVIQAITRQNIQYSRDLQAITAKIDNYNKQKARIDTQSADIENDFKSAEKKISLAGVSPVLGKILREQRRNLLTQNQFTLQSELIQGETATTSLEGFKVEDNLKSLYDVDTRLQEIMAQQVDQKLATEQRMMIQAELRVLLDGQKELLNKLSGAYTRYLRTLGDFDFSRQQMLVSSSKFAAFLDERLLWVPSSEPINAHFISELYHSAHWLLSPSNWAMVLNDTLKTASRWPFLTFLGMVNLGALLRYKNWAKQQVTATSDKVGKFHTDRFHYTVQALALTLLLVLPLPLFLYYFGLFLSSNVQASDFSKAIGVGLRGAAAPLFLLQFFYRLLVPTGIACQHFQWQQTAASLLRSQLGWLRFIAVSTVFIIGTLGASKATVYSDSLGRLALIISMVALAVFFGRVLNPTRGVVKHAIAENAHSGWVKLRYLWYPAFILIPLVIVGFAVAGYYLSALELQQKLIVSLRLIFLVVVIHEMVYRWLTLVNRQLAMENVRQRRKSAALSEKQQPTMAGEDPVLPLDEQLVDIPKINAQTIRLLNLFIGFGLMIGFWMIWKNILPAFSFLDNIALWQHKVNIDNQESTQPITLTNLMLAGLYVFITVVSVRNF